MKTMFKAIKGATWRVIKQEVIRETASYIITAGEYRHQKTADLYKFFDNERDAWLWLAGQAESAAFDHRKKAEKYEEEAARILEIISSLENQAP